jgi:hypothetical protein
MHEGQGFSIQVSFFLTTEDLPLHQHWNLYTIATKIEIYDILALIKNYINQIY